MQLDVRMMAAFIVLLTGSVPAVAADTAVGVGTKLTQADLVGMFAIPPDGFGLPPGQGTAAQGAAVYAERCSACHGKDLEGVKAIGAPPLVGGRGTLATKPLKTVESYWPYATTLFDYVKRAMPMNAPGSLSNDQVYAVSAYILAGAHIVTEASIVDAKTLPQIRMPNRQGFVNESAQGNRR